MGAVHTETQTTLSMHLEIHCKSSGQYSFLKALQLNHHIIHYKNNNLNKSILQIKCNPQDRQYL